MHKLFILITTVLIVCACTGGNSQKLDELEAFADSVEQHAPSYTAAQMTAARNHLDSLNREISALDLSSKEIARFGKLAGRCAGALTPAPTGATTDSLRYDASHNQQMLDAADAMMDSMKRQQ